MLFHPDNRLANTVILQTNLCKRSSRANLTVDEEIICLFVEVEGELQRICPFKSVGKAAKFIMLGLN